MLEKILPDAMARSRLHYMSSTKDWDGWDWWQLSPEEAEVFGLQRERWAELVPVWQAFEFFMGRTDGWNDEEIECDYPELHVVMQAAREAHPPWAGQDAGDNRIIFMRFAEHFAGVAHREAHAIFAKMDFWAARTGVAWYADEKY